MIGEETGGRRLDLARIKQEGGVLGTHLIRIQHKAQLYMSVSKSHINCSGQPML